MKEALARSKKHPVDHSVRRASMVAPAKRYFPERHCARAKCHPNPRRALQLEWRRAGRRDVRITLVIGVIFAKTGSTYGRTHSDDRAIHDPAWSRHGADLPGIWRTATNLVVLDVDAVLAWLTNRRYAQGFGSITFLCAATGTPEPYPRRQTGAASGETLHRSPVAAVMPCCAAA